MSTGVHELTSLGSGRYLSFSLSRASFRSLCWLAKPFGCACAQWPFRHPKLCVHAVLCTTVVVLRFRLQCMHYYRNRIRHFPATHPHNIYKHPNEVSACVCIEFVHALKEAAVCRRRCPQNACCVRAVSESALW